VPPVSQSTVSGCEGLHDASAVTQRPALSQLGVVKFTLRNPQSQCEPLGQSLACKQPPAGTDPTLESGGLWFSPPLLWHASVCARTMTGSSKRQESLVSSFTGSF
jgi:hypothetical protein